MMTMNGTLVVVSVWNEEQGQHLVFTGSGPSINVDGQPDDTWRLTLLANNPEAGFSPNPVSGIGRVKVSHNGILQFEEWNCAFNNFLNGHTPEMGTHTIDLDPGPAYVPGEVDSYAFMSGTVLGSGMQGSYSIVLSMPQGACFDEFGRFFMLFSFVSSIGLPISSPAGDDPPIIYHR